MISERHRIPTPGTPEFDAAYEVIVERLRDYNEVLDELTLAARNATSLETAKSLITIECDRIRNRVSTLNTDLALLKAQLVKQPNAKRNAERGAKRTKGKK